MAATPSTPATSETFPFAKEKKFNDAFVGMVLVQQQISVANAAKHALEEKNTLPLLGDTRLA